MARGRLVPIACTIAQVHSVAQKVLLYHANLGGDREISPPFLHLHFVLLPSPELLIQSSLIDLVRLRQSRLFLPWQYEHLDSSDGILSL